MCDRIRSEDNVFADGEACSASDAIGNAALDASGAPTAASALLLGRADPLVAPPMDYFGCPRAGVPDIGAIELGACPAVTAPAPPLAEPVGATSRSSRVRARARILSLRSRRFAHRVEVFVRCSNATRLVAAVLVHGRVVASASQSGSLRHRATFKLRAPRRGRIELRIRAVGAGGDVARVISVRALPR
jgi:hypothetical protein